MSEPDTHAMVPNPEDGVPERVLRWVIDSVDPSATVVRVERLHGGASSLVHSVSLSVGSEARHFVLRRFDNERWLEEEPDLARHEAASLVLAAQSKANVTRIVAFDETGSECGIPAVLMTWLEGAVVLNPPDRTVWIERLAESLAHVHTIDAGDFSWKYFTYYDIAGRETPTWTHFPEQWDVAIRLARQPRPSFRPCFIHRDYHPANVLWSGDRISGIVDWVNACEGPAGVDIGHCRANLAQLFGVSAADEFLAAYEKCAGPAFRYEPYWDLVALMDFMNGPPAVFSGWIALGVTGLTDELMRERIDDYLLSLVSRASVTPVETVL